MLIFGFERLITVGGFLGAVSSLMGAYAVIQSRRTEQRSATREETQQALDAQNVLLDRYEKRIEHLETRNNALHGQVNKALGQLAIAKETHKECEKNLKITKKEHADLATRLHIAEQKIAELGG